MCESSNDMRSGADRTYCSEAPRPARVDGVALRPEQKPRSERPMSERASRRRCAVQLMAGSDVESLCVDAESSKAQPNQWPPGTRRHRADSVSP